MTALASADARRLTSCLSRLASPHAGEIVAAAQAAGRILDKAGLGFADLTVAPALASPKPSPPSHAHQIDARRCLAGSPFWKPHEREFLAQMARQRREPSDKQRAWLDGLLDRLADIEAAA